MSAARFTAVVVVSETSTVELPEKVYNRETRREEPRKDRRSAEVLKVTLRADTADALAEQAAKVLSIVGGLGA
ncbi:hypothetical protein SEA_GRETCHEN_36 [Microbacterium phage Gretchen]|uniref:Uncharacterized protein n=1 Tax=Microbacterium phage Percival TaxID=2201439 RepID=A0A2Z4Q6W8_9CAUD|nr:hypothetical protein PBI_PERCIVAL_36 [Microbacterium phage Percival]UDL14810.1 hypothetical protein SEA_GRETCHEN_36 [Microbacterium phage Gretchen]